MDLDIKPERKYYVNIINIMLPRPREYCATYEYDTHGLLHCNYVFCCFKKLDYTIIKYKGCHIHLERLTKMQEMFRTMKYIHKDYELKYGYPQY